MTRRGPSRLQLVARFLSERTGRVIDGREIEEACGGGEWNRRIRELINEFGWPIDRGRDCADLKPTQYRLREPPPHGGSLERRYRIDRSISAATRARILRRNGFTCQHCGRGAGDRNEHGGTTVLSIGHINDAYSGGSAEDHNLRVLCALCNGGEKNLAPAPPRFLKVMAVLRPADEDVQQKVLDWLSRKFASRAPAKPQQPELLNRGD